jgi:hypothetical protein
MAILNEYKRRKDGPIYVPVVTTRRRRRRMKK